MDGGKSLNDRGGARRYVFKSDAVIARELAESVARDVRAPHERALEPDRGAAGCFFADELRRWKELEMNDTYKKFHARVGSLSRTLASLIHHRDVIAGELASALSIAGASAGTGNYAPVRAFCALVGVLARDLRGAIRPVYSSLAGALRSVIDAGSAAAGAEAFRALSFIFKYAAAELLASDTDAGSDIISEWSGYLNSRKIVLRDMTAAALTILLRRASADAERARLTSVLRSLSAAPAPPLSRGNSILDIRGLAAGAAGAAVRARGVHARDGAARLIFESLRGPIRGLHSRAPGVLAAILEVPSPRLSRVAAIAQRAASDGPDALGTLGAARAEAAVDLYALSLAQRAEVVTQAVRYTCAHVSVSHQSALRTVWGALLAAVMRALDVFVAGTDEAPSAVPFSKEAGGSSAVVADRVAMELQAARAARLKSRLAESAPPSTLPKSGGPAEANGDKSTTDKFRRVSSLHIAQLTGALLAWTSYRGGAHVPKGGLARLALCLRRLFSDSIWRASATAPVLRAVCLRLLLASWLLVAVPRTATQRHVASKDSEVKLHRALGRARSAAAKAPVSKRARKAAASVARRTQESDSDSAQEGGAEPAVRGRDEAAAAEVVAADGAAFSRGVDATAADEATDDDGAGDDGASAASALSAMLLRAVFTPLEPESEDAVGDATGVDAGAGGITIAVTAASSGLLLAAPSAEGPIFPNTARCGRNSDFRVSAVASLKPSAQRLSFARALLALTAHWGERLRSHGASKVPFHADAPRATLIALLPPLGEFCETLLDADAGAPGVGARSDVLWSMLLSARDAIVPRGAARGEEELVSAVRGSISASGRLHFKGSIERGLVSALKALVPEIGKVVAALRADAAGLIAENTDLITILSRAYGIVSSSAAVVPTPEPAVAALLAVAHAAEAPLNQTSPLACGLAHVRASALLNIARIIVDVDGGYKVADHLMGQGAIFSATHGLKWALEAAACVAAMIETPCKNASQAVTRSCAVALAALNAAASLADALRHSGHGHEGLLRVAAGNTVTSALLPLFAHRESALRLAALRLSCAFEPPLRAASPEELSGFLPPSLLGLQRRVLLDEFEMKDHGEDDGAEQHSPVLTLMLTVEAAPNTLELERSRVAALGRLRLLIERRRLPIAHAAAAIHYALGILFIHFAPLHAPARAVLAAAATAYPKTTWDAFASALLAAAVDRAPLRDATVGAGDEDVVDAASHASANPRSRSASRAERSSSGVVPLRVGAVAACAAGGAAAGAGASGVAGDGGSRASSVRSAAAASFASGASGATRAADGGEAAGVVDASGAIEAGGPELVFRFDSVLDRGLWGADAASVSTQTDSRGPRGIHNELPPLAIGEGGSIDAEARHASLLTIIDDAGEWAAGRARSLVAFFLAFLRDDFYGRTHGDDPDGEELGVSGALTKCVARGGLTAAISPWLQQNATLLDSLEAGVISRARAALPVAAAQKRLVSWLRVMERLPGAANVEGGAAIRSLCERLIGRPETGLAEAALRVLVAFKTPHVVPYKEAFFRFLGDRTFRDELANFPLSPATCKLSLEHRAAALMLLLRLLFGRLLARRGASGRDSLSARRAATLGYVAQLDASESGLVLALATRHFLRAFGGGSVPSSDSSTALLKFLDAIHRPMDAEAASALVAAARSAFAPPEGGRGAAAVTAQRAIGLLHLLKDLVRHMGHKLAHHLHVVAAIVVACVIETAPRTMRIHGGGIALVDDENDVDGVDELLNNEELPGDEDFAKNDADAAVKIDETSRGGDDADDDAKSIHSTASAAGVGVTGVAQRAKDIRPLSIATLCDLISVFATDTSAGGGADALRAFVPAISSALGAAITALPPSAASASKPSALFSLLTTAARHEAALGMLASLPQAVPALMACISAGMPGAAGVFAAHCAHAAGRSGGAEDITVPANAQSAHAGPAAPIVAAVFSFVEAFLSNAEGADADDHGAAARAHIPFLLNHLFVRLSAGSSGSSLAWSADGSASTSADASSAMHPRPLPSLKGTNRAFARRTLALLARVANLSTTSLSANVCERLVSLLLPFLSLRPRTEAAVADDAAAAKEDPIKLVFGIVSSLAPHLRAPAASSFFPVFVRLLAPGPKTLAPQSRRSAVGVLLALAAKSVELGPIDKPLRILTALTSLSAKQLDTPDFDSVLGGLEALALPEFCEALFRSSSEGGAVAALPALLYQILFLLMDKDAAVRTGAAAAGSAVVRAAGAAAVAGGVTANDAQSVLIPALRAALATSSATLRRGIILLFADCVRAFAALPGAPHADLAAVTLEQDDVEADIFLNLVHVQIHRRARALGRLAAAVRAGALGDASVRHFCLPIALHALHDDSGGGGELLVVSKGRSARLHEKSGRGRSGGTDASAASGLHHEAVRLFGAVGAVASYSLFASTFRTLVRLATSAPLGPLEKVLVRALTALTDSWHWDVRAPVGDAGARFDMPESDLVGLLGRALSTKGAAARFAVTKAQALSYGGGAAAPPANTAEESGDAGDADEADSGADSDTVEDARVAQDDHGEKPVHSADEAVSAEIERRSILLDLSTNLIPSLEKLLNRIVPGDEAEGNNEDGWTRGAGDGIDARGAKPKNAPPRGFGELRPHVATALVSLLRQLPARNYSDAYPTLLFRLCAALRSRAESHRETARATLARVAVALGPKDALLPILDALSNALREGYQVHVLGHAVYAVLDALAPKMVPLEPRDDASKAAVGVVVEGESESSGDSVAAESSAALVAAIPKLMEILLDEAPSESTAADDSSGYRPSADLSLKEAKSSRTGDSLEILGRCIPFLPSPAIHSLLAPLVSLLDSGRTLSSPRLADAVDSYMRRVQTGLSANPSVTGPYAMLYAHGICVEFLNLTSGAKSVRNEDEEEDEEEEESECEVERAEGLESVLEPGAVPASSKAGEAATPSSSLLPDDVPSIVAAFEKLQQRMVSRGAAGGRQRLRHVVSWLPTDARAALGLATSGGMSGSDMSAAMRQRGAGVTSANADVWRVLPEPRMTGSGRYAAADGAAVNSGSSSGRAAGSALGCFSLTFLLSALSRGRITSKNASHVTMLDTFVPILLELVERGGGGDARVLLPALRVLTALLPYPLPMLRRAAARLVRLILLSVHEHSSAGRSGESRRARDALGPRSELAHAALRAATVLVRACDYARVPEAALVGLLELARGDLPIAPRQGGALALLRAIVGRRLMAALVYDVMDDTAALIVRALRPSARAAAAGVFLTFLLRYPMAERVLQRHLNFFLSNLGYLHEDGRLAVVDVLAACVSRFPVAVLDAHAPLVFLALVARLSADPSARARAAVGATIGLLASKASIGVAAKLADMAVEWFSPKNKASVRRVGAHCLGLVADARGAHVFGAADAATAERVARVVQLLAGELGAAAVNIAQLEAAAAAAIAPQQAARGRGVSDVGHDADEADAHAALAVAGNEAAEDEDRALARELCARTSGIAGEDDAAVDALYALPGREGDAVEAEEAAPGAAADAASAAAFAAVDAAPTTAPAASVHLEWETVYYALLASERIMRVAGAAFEAAINANVSDKRVYESAPQGWLPSVRSPQACPVAAAVDLLTYPHMWVRLAAARLVGAYISSRGVPGDGSTLPVSGWSASAPALVALAHRTVSTLSASALGPALAPVATGNLVFATLSLAHLDARALPALFSRVVRSAGYRAADAGKAATLRWLAACSLRLRGESLSALIEPAARLLHRLLDVELKPGDVSDDTKALASEALEILSTQAGAADITRALHAERSRASALRSERKAAAAIQRVVDPAGAAAAKSRKQAAKAMGKRKAVDKFRTEKGKKPRL